MKPYGLMADLHLHNWNAFSFVTIAGINNRLQGLLHEILRCGDEVLAAGGDTIYIAGDVFHVRGSIAPSVLNPTLDAFRSLTSGGIKVIILPGNHDLEGKHSDRLGSAITALEGVGVRVCHDIEEFPKHGVMTFPWFEKVEELRDCLQEVNPDVRENTVAILHAPLDGTIAGLPNHGIDPEWLGALNYRSVYAGHYHHHKEFDHHICSIGALAHHSWSDVGTKSGFLIIEDTGPRWMKSRLPEFIDITGDVDPVELPLIVEGNFVRAKIESSLMSDVESLRAELIEMGAKGVVIQCVKKPVVARDGVISASVKAGASLETSVAEYAASKSFPDAARVATECMNVLAEAGC